MNETDLESGGGTPPPPPPLLMSEAFFTIHAFLSAQYLKKGFQVVCDVLTGHSIAGTITLQLYNYLGRGMARGPAQQDTRES